MSEQSKENMVAQQSAWSGGGMWHEVTSVLMGALQVLGMRASWLEGSLWASPRRVSL